MPKVSVKGLKNVGGVVVGATKKKIAKGITTVRTAATRKAKPLAGGKVKMYAAGAEAKNKAITSARLKTGAAATGVVAVGGKVLVAKKRRKKEV